METILFIAVLVLAVLHFQLRARMQALETRLDEEGLGPMPADQRLAPQPESAAGASTLAVTRRPAEAPAAPPGAQSAAQRPQPDSFVTADAVDAHASERPERASLAALFEQFVGGRLLIWIGGIALAVAGIFLIRFSAGLITPAVRMVLAALFGLALLAAGELARSRPGKLPDARVPQALIGAGILVLYAAPYGALTLYQLISIATASTLMVMVTAAALVLSLRHGAPAGVMGLAGGFATPLLVGDPNSGAIPLLGYLALLDIALFAIAARRGWTWLAAAAVLLSFVWTGFLLAEPASDALAAGLFILALGIGGSMLRAGPGWQLDFIRPAALGLVQLAVLVARTDLGTPAWLLFGSLSAAAFLLATRRADYRPIPALALGVALLLILFKAELGKEILPEAAGVTLLFAAGAVPLALRRPERLLWTATATAAFAGPALILRLQQGGMFLPSWWGMLLALLALGPLLLAGALGHADGKAKLVAASGAALLAAVAMADLLPADLVPAGWLAMALIAAFAARSVGDGRLGGLAIAIALAALAMAAIRVAPFWTALMLSLGGIPPLAVRLPASGAALLALALPGALLLALLRLMPAGRSRAWLLGGSLFCLVLSAYLLFKQAWGLADAQDFVARGFAERLIVTQALFLIGWAVCRFPLPGLDEPARRTIGLVFTALAAARLLWFDIVVANPVLVEQWVGRLPVANLVLPAYLLGAFWLYSARRDADNAFRSAIWLTLFLAGLVAGVMLLVRQGFQGAILTAPIILSEESYAYSLAGLLLSLALLLSGIRLADKALRIAGLALLTATILKVFLIDASALEGVLRILSFMGLGIALIGIGKLYTKVLDAERKTGAAQSEGS